MLSLIFFLKYFYSGQSRGKFQDGAGCMRLRLARARAGQSRLFCPAWSPTSHLSPVLLIELNTQSGRSGRYEGLCWSCIVTIRIARLRWPGGREEESHGEREEEPGREGEDCPHWETVEHPKDLLQVAPPHPHPTPQASNIFLVLTEIFSLPAPTPGLMLLWKNN